MTTIGTTHHERPRLLSLAKQAKREQPQNPKTSQNEKHIQTSTTLTKVSEELIRLFGKASAK